DDVDAVVGPTPPQAQEGRHEAGAAVHRAGHRRSAGIPGVAAADRSVLLLHRVHTLTPPEWVGLANYQAMFADPVFWNSLKVTVLYVAINIGVQTVVALVIAVLMQRLTQSTVLRSLVLAPYLVSNVVAAIVFLWILDTQLGIFNVFLQWIGFDPVAFWASETWVIPTIALVNVWRHVGYTALLLFAGLQAIPGHLYEAARTDGAG